MHNTLFPLVLDFKWGFFFIPCPAGPGRLEARGTQETHSLHPGKGI